jgi:hypothetical protein
MGRDLDIVLYAKVDIPGPNPNDGLEVFNTPGNLSSGTWSTDDLINFIAVKAGPEFALYEYIGGASSGDWTTELLSYKDLSHLSAYQILSSVAEPATLALFGLGLVGLAAVSGRRFSKKK